MNLSVLRRLLPGWEFKITDGGWLHFAPNGHWSMNRNTSDDFDCHILCGEIERALLARVDQLLVSCMVFGSFPSGQASPWWTVAVTCSGGRFQEDEPTKLLALVAVAEKVLDQ